MEGLERTGEPGPGSDILFAPQGTGGPLLTLLVTVAAWGAAGSAIPVASIPGANLQRPSWSPDGSQLAFEANFHDAKRIELYVGAPKPGGFEQVQATRRSNNSITAGFTKTATGEVAHELSWAPTRVGGELFVFSASNRDQDYDLYVRGGTAIAPAPGADGGAVWAPDGGSIVFTSSRTGQGDLYLITTDAIESTPLQLTSMQESSELYVTWAPDGRSLVFVAHSESGDNLWYLPAVGAAPARVTTWPGNQIRPRFAPNDDLIAFYANHENADRFDLYVVKIGAVPQLLVRGVYPDARGPAWTPDGKHIVFVANDDTSYDPVKAVNVQTKRLSTIPVGTVGNGDIDVVVREGKLWLAVVAQGRRTDKVRDFKRLYLAEVGSLP